MGWINELVALERLSQSTITFAVDGLEARGWVERRRSGEDRRAVWVAITDAGSERKRRLHADAEVLLRERLGGLDAAQYAAVQEAGATLALVVRALEEGEQG